MKTLQFETNNAGTFYPIRRVVAAFALDRIMCSNETETLPTKAHSTPSFHDTSTLAFFNSRRTVPRIWGMTGSGVS